MTNRNQRILDFYGRRCPFAITVALPMPADVKQRIDQKASALSPKEFPSAQLLFPMWEEWLSWREHSGVDDDKVEYIYSNQYDQGIYGAMFGAKMEFLLQPGWGWASSNSAPFEDKSYDELLALRFDPQNHWLRRMREDLQYFAQQCRGRFGISTIITIDGFNFAHQIRGSKFFDDIYDCPEKLKALLDLAVEINIQCIEWQRAASGETCAEGSLALGGLFPARTIAMSVDTYNMCSPATYAEFGRPYHQRLIDHFGGGAFHLHGNGRHLLAEMAKLSGMVHVSIGDDGAAVRAFEDRANIRKLAGDLLIDISCSPDELEQAIRERTLVTARYNVYCENTDRARRLVEQFRAYQQELGNC